MVVGGGGGCVFRTVSVTVCNPNNLIAHVSTHLSSQTNLKHADAPTW